MGIELLCNIIIYHAIRGKQELVHFTREFTNIDGLYFVNDSGSQILFFHDFYFPLLYLQDMLFFKFEFSC